ncbi:Oidioi.mRNA.OKI2018_I69.XSR.g17017.t1.cds [Oikopleura dioica]|uniref:Oidioi.mRNA.OKI2018_I69.XSR.g17017.t1.cds n=1 Tax=Oikopleura dioica TaxID=34765 RepID=A0ABN7SLQ5_OIKDI|nr:Oidioi.mRNA.OKI2018_I69.XSR.g17017.t1.cds [Oikopleura dioica]
MVYNISYSRGGITGASATTNIPGENYASDNVDTHPPGYIPGRRTIQQPPAVNSSRADNVIYFDETVTLEEARRKTYESSLKFGIDKERVDQIFSKDWVPDEQTVDQENTSAEKTDEVSLDHDLEKTKTWKKSRWQVTLSYQSQYVTQDENHKKSKFARVKDFMARSISPFNDKKKRKKKTIPKSNEAFKLSIGSSDEEQTDVEGEFAGSIVNQTPTLSEQECLPHLVYEDKTAGEENNNESEKMFSEREVDLKLDKSLFSRSHKTRLTQRNIRSPRLGHKPHLESPLVQSFSRTDNVRSQSHIKTEAKPNVTVSDDEKEVHDADTPKNSCGFKNNKNSPTSKHFYPFYKYDPQRPTNQARVLQQKDNATTSKVSTKNFLVKTLRYPIGEIERGLNVDSDIEQRPGAIDSAAVRYLTRVRNPYAPEDEPDSLMTRMSEEELRYATIRRSYSFRYKYSNNFIFPL